jgi:cation diffusion facilitator family transporter
MIERVFGDDMARRAAAASIATNGVLMVLKLTVGVISGSVAVLSDGIDSLEDVIAAGITYASLRYGARPPDATHPYGHGRAETLAATFQGLLIGTGGVFILFRAVDRVLNPPDSIDTGIAIAVMLVAAAANFALVQYTSRVAKQTGSPAIASEARHLWTNVVQAGAVTLGLIAVAVTGVIEFDGAIAFVLGLYLLWIAARILWSSGADVLDSSLEPEEVRAIEAAIQDSAGAGGAFHGLRTRRSGQVRHIDLHLTLPGTMTVDESHAIADRVESRLEALYPGSAVTIHVEPDTETPKNAGL